MSEIKEFKSMLEKATKGEDWTNFDGKTDSLFVYEYDSLTEDTCDIIAECKSVEIAKFISTVPEQFRTYITTIESQNEKITDLESQKSLLDEILPNLEVSGKIILDLQKQIDAQKEEIKKKTAESELWLKQNKIIVKNNADYKSKIESLKAITELAVKAVENIEILVSYSECSPNFYEESKQIFDTFKTEIERLQNEK